MDAGLGLKTIRIVPCFSSVGDLRHSNEAKSWCYQATRHPRGRREIARQALFYRGRRQIFSAGFHRDLPEVWQLARSGRENLIQGDGHIPEAEVATTAAYVETYRSP